MRWQANVRPKPCRCRWCGNAPASPSPTKWRWRRKILSLPQYGHLRRDGLLGPLPNIETTSARQGLAG